MIFSISNRLNFSTPFSSNAVSICHSIGLTFVTRLEVFTRYLIKWEQDGLDIGNDIVEEVREILKVFTLIQEDSYSAKWCDHGKNDLKPVSKKKKTLKFF